MVESSIQLHTISFSYPNGDSAINAIDLEIPLGKKIALLGGNGAGKSTLMLLLNGILKPSEGHLTYNAVPYEYNKKGLRGLRSKIGLLFPEPDYQLIAPTVYEEISFGLLNKFQNENIVREKVEKALNDFNLKEISSKAPHQLSTGQKKRICLAAILAMEPEVLVCDEPTSNLDPFYTSLIFEYLNDLNSKGKTIIISTHDVDLAYDWADYYIVLNKGNVLSYGNKSTIFSNKDLLLEANLKQPMLVELYTKLNGSTVHKLPDTIDDLVKEIQCLMKQ